MSSTQDRNYIYKIIPSSAPPPSPLPLALPLSDLDAKDGFIHASDARQTLRTAGMFFCEEERIYVAKIPLLPILVDGGVIGKQQDGEVGGKRKEVKWEGEGEDAGCAHVYQARSGGQMPRLGSGEIVDVKLFERKQGERWEDVLARHSDWIRY